MTSQHSTCACMLLVLRYTVIIDERRTSSAPTPVVLLVHVGGVLARVLFRSFLCTNLNLRSSFDLLKPAAKERRCCENANEAVSPLIVVERPALPCLPCPSRPQHSCLLSRQAWSGLVVNSIREHSSGRDQSRPRPALIVKLGAAVACNMLNLVNATDCHLTAD